MNNKRNLILLTFVPIIIGHIVNRTIMVPTIGMFIFYIVPFFVMAFWFYLGNLYSKTNWKPVAATLIGNMTGFVSLVLYVWQFIFVNDEGRSFFIARFSQMFSASMPTYLFARIAMLFELQLNYAGRTTMLMIQVMAIGLMTIIFGRVEK